MVIVNIVVKMRKILLEILLVILVIGVKEKSLLLEISVIRGNLMMILEMMVSLKPMESDIGMLFDHVY